jgi:hypothetical protein
MNRTLLLPAALLSGLLISSCDKKGAEPATDPGGANAGAEAEPSTGAQSSAPATGALKLSPPLQGVAAHLGEAGAH